MITKGDFLRVQELLGRAGSFSKMEEDRAESRPKFRNFTFTGCMTCAECGCAITAEIKKKRSGNGHEKKYIYYHCTHRKDKRGFRCPQRECVEERKLEAQISGILSKIRVHSRFLEWARKELKRCYVEETEVGASVSESINRSMKEGIKKRDRLMDAYLDGLIDRQNLEEKKREIDESIANFQLKHKAAEERAKQWTSLMNRAFTYAACAEEVF